MAGCKTKTICFTNNKGGSGKSTTCANLAFELTSAGKKVLLIDGDMQLNLSLSFFDEERVLEMAECEENLYYAIKNKRDLRIRAFYNDTERVCVEKVLAQHL